MYELLMQIQCSNDVKKLDTGALDALCAELRAFLIENVAKTGGHLASNLGVVELTVALHRLFDSNRDRIVFDVGHQSYVHKILTGRRGGFSSLRTLGGLAGFPKPEESHDDAFVTGHASTAVSAALGMARGRTRQGDRSHIIAVVGDGALTGGMTYEALNDAGQSGEPLIVILNDNGMSITKNVGGVARHLARLRVKPQYFRLKKLYHRVIKILPGGKSIDKALHTIKSGVKDALLPGSMFESMGFTYLGPTDGHDIKTVISLLEQARDLRRPVLIHLTTVKGKGYKYAEQNPSSFHGVGSFDVKTGLPSSPGKESFSSVFGEHMVRLARSDSRICAISAAMTSGTGLEEFARLFPERFFDVGIAESHAVTMAAGMASMGMVPVVALYSTFLQRAYDMILHDLAIAKLHVVLAVDRAGLSGEDGETHHGIFDVPFLSHVPGINILCPANFAELEMMLGEAVSNIDGVVAVRYPRGGEGSFRKHYPYHHPVVLRPGSDAVLVGYGPMVGRLLQAAELLAVRGIQVQVIKLGCIRPLACGEIFDLTNNHAPMIVAEDCVDSGSAGQAIAAEAARCGYMGKVVRHNLGGSFVTHGDVESLYHMYLLDAEGIAAALTRHMDTTTRRVIRHA